LGQGKTLGRGDLSRVPRAAFPPVFSRLFDDAAHASGDAYLPSLSFPTVTAAANGVMVQSIARRRTSHTPRRAIDAMCARRSQVARAGSRKVHRAKA
jgi:hypothetical protein